MVNRRVLKISTSGLTAHACCPYSGITLVRVNGGGGLLKAGWISLIPGCNGADTNMRVRVGFCVMAPSTVRRGFIHGCNFNRYPEDGSHTQWYKSRYKSAIWKTRMRVLLNGLPRNTFVTTKQPWQRLKTTQTTIIITKITFCLIITILFLVLKTVNC